MCLVFKKKCDKIGLTIYMLVQYQKGGRHVACLCGGESWVDLPPHKNKQTLQACMEQAKPCKQN